MCIRDSVRSLREMITYGLKGMAAYAEHAKNIGKEDLTINAFIYEALAATLDDSLSADDLVEMCIRDRRSNVRSSIISPAYYYVWRTIPFFQTG